MRLIPKPLSKAIKLYYLNLDKSQRCRIVLLVLLSLFAAILESISIVLTIPLLSTFLGERTLEDITAVAHIIIALGLTGPQFLACTWFSAILLAGFTRIIFTRETSRTCALVTSSLAYRIFGSSLTRDFLFYKINNSSDLKSDLTNRVDELSQFSFFLIQLSSSISSASILFLAVFIADPQASLLAMSFALAFYIIIVMFSNKSFVLSSTAISQLYEQRMRILGEAYSAITEIMIYSNHSYFTDRYYKIESKLKYLQFRNKFRSTVPRYLLELLLYVVIFVVGVFQYKNSGISSFLTTILFLALALQKIIPQFQSVYNSFSVLLSFTSSVTAILQSIKCTKDYSLQPSAAPRLANPKIVLNDISYNYPNTNISAVLNLSYTFQHGSKVCLIGPSGSGKTTLLSLILGLLPPTSGFVQLNEDDKLLLCSAGNTIEYRSYFSYVPQTTHFSDTSILDNILDGQPYDYDRLVHCCKIAECYDFIDDLSCKFNTSMGESGALLSGGQLQRIAVSRALYRSKPILILDESLSAVDHETAMRITSNIIQSQTNSTVILVTHDTLIPGLFSEVLRLKQNTHYKVI